MKCLVDFLSDIYQKRLRRMSQSQADNYEEALDLYKEIFISQLRCAIKYSKECKDCKLKCSIGCNKLRELLESITDEEIYSFFKVIKEIYILWIDAKWSESLRKFTEFMEHYNILEDLEAADIKNSILFRGRVSKSILTPWDMYHIPFNKRYLVSNQRYSLTGQPMIYLGSSIVDIIEELEINDEQLKDFKVSTYKINKEIKIYDLRNNIYKDINENLIQDNSTLKLFSTKAFDESKFFRNLLSSVCSFEKRKEYKGFSFCEEYVIPQILAQTLKKEKFDGIAYYSTKKFDEIKFHLSEEVIKNDKDNSSEYNKITKTKYKENVALFTNFTLDHVYDRLLFDNLKISVPIDINRIEELNMSELDYIYNEIGKMKEQSRITEATIIYSNFRREFDECYIGKLRYYETSIGKLHIYHIYIILNNILAKCKKEVN
ncbi:hypothetical protein [Romboutsia sp.]|uniref:hypothetical protein n=1 Tax=Romboutsia sp. TaxID=1965302 RepID=UPI002B6C6E97|nr:hypothetical protein [Romboutsia sp.]HSQ89385.1 hypothetical protein [Romboutsia sp.]